MPYAVLLPTGKEYCMSDEFQATCGTNEVIIVTSAQYGRMALGRCVDEDIGHLGCANDALEVMDELCSGTASCEVDVAKQTKRLWRDGDTACPKALMGYLDVEYTCKQGTACTSVAVRFHSCIALLAITMMCKTALGNLPQYISFQSPPYNKKVVEVD